MKTAALRYSLLGVGFGLLICAAAAMYLRASASDEIPRVQLNAENVGPRQIEELTGFEKDELTQRVKSQIKSGLHTRYQDRGHKLEAIFYAPAGDAMELRDR